MSQETRNGFDRYPGEYDFWRTPLKEPYEIHSIDTLARGSLNTWKFGTCRHGLLGHVSIDGITHYAFRDPHLAGKTESDWFIFNVDTCEIGRFPSKAAFDEACAAVKMPVDLDLSTVEKNHNDYWQKHYKVDAWEAIFGSVFLLVMTAVVIGILIGALLLLVGAAILAIALIGLGVLSTSMLVGLVGRSISAGLGTFFVLACSAVCIPLGIGGAWLGARVLHFGWPFRIVALAGGTGGLLAGVIIGLGIHMTLRWIYRLLRRGSAGAGTTPDRH